MGVGDIYEMVMTFDMVGELYQTKWHFLGIHANSNADALAQVPTTYDVWGEYRKQCSHDLHFTQVDTKRVRPKPSSAYPLETATFYPGITGQSMEGAVVDEIFDTMTCAIVTLKTAQLGKRGRGRWYWGAVPAQYGFKGRINNGDLGNYQNNANHLLNDTGIGSSGNSGFRWCLWSPNSSEPDGEFAQNAFPITSVLVSKRWGHLHSRKIGAGQ